MENIDSFPIYVFHEGKNYQAYKLLSPHRIKENGQVGWVFHLWAPQAKSVSVVGDFNGWNRSSHPMEKVSVGIWRTFIPFLEDFDLYKYSVEGADGRIVEKADPFALHTETPPKNASRLFSIGRYNWEDKDWMEKRKDYAPYNKPLNIYEVHAGSWRTYPDGQPFGYRKLAEELIPYLVDMNYTHVELLPLTEHPFNGSWGYQVTGMYAPTSRFGAPDDLMYFVDKCHQAGIGVIMDWVPAHFPKDSFGLAKFDGAPLYEYADPKKGEHPQWGTLIYDYGRNEVRSFLISSANFWLKEYHMDGIRMDAVASMLYLDYGKNPGEWIPNVDGGNINLEAVSLLKELNSAVIKENPGVLMIAEESTSFPNITKPPYDGGLGFNFKWNMGWMNDTLRYMTTDPFFRKEIHNNMTFSLMYAFNENYVLPLSHDEVVHCKGSLINKMPGYYNDKFASLMTYLGYMYAHPGKKLLFMGGEFAQFIEWNYNQGLDWMLLDYDTHKGVQNFVRDLNRYYRDTPAMWDQDTGYEGFKWLQVEDKNNNVYAFMRIAKDGSYTIAVFNFSNQDLKHYWIGVPDDGIYHTVLDSRDIRYGSGIRLDDRPVSSKDGGVGHQPFDYHIEIDLDPFSVQYIELQSKRVKEEKKEVVEEKPKKAKKTTKTTKKTTAKKPAKSGK